jgi:hypothetical protein
MNAHVAPRRFWEIDVVVLCSFLDVRKRQSTAGTGDLDDLVEPRHRVTHMLCVGQWFFPLRRKRVDVERLPPVAQSPQPSAKFRSGDLILVLCEAFLESNHWSFPKTRFSSSSSNGTPRIIVRPISSRALNDRYGSWAAFAATFAARPRASESCRLCCVAVVDSPVPCVDHCLNDPIGSALIP